MKEKKATELLAPAGSYESMEAAFAAGADAVYIGGSRFGARAYAQNLDEEMLCRAIDYAHLHGRRLYLTVNTLLKEQELHELYDYLFPYYRQGLDGVIVQDLGAMALMREAFPDLPLHASTQMTITGVHGAKMLKELGASRIVTARELSLEEIRRIHEEVDIEIESFIHGALCYCYSGQCLMSSLIGGRSGNRGRCAQPCRLPYEILQSRHLQNREYLRDEARQNIYRQGNPFPDDNQKNENRKKEKKSNLPQNRYYLNMKDLCTLELLPDILEAGVYSLKIEGRMKSPRYTAGVVSIYRKYLDVYLQHGREKYRVQQEDRQHLLDLFDRGGFTDGYYSRHNGKDMLALAEKPAFREVNQPFFDELDRQFVNKKLQEPVSGAVKLVPGEEATLVLNMMVPSEETSVCVSGSVVQEAKNHPVTREGIEKQLNKTGNSPFYFHDLKVFVSGNSFIPVQALNELRRTGLEALERKLLSVYTRGQSGNTEGKTVLRGACGLSDADAKAISVSCKKAVSCRKNVSAEEAAAAFLTVSVEEQNQLSPVLNCPEVREIYIDADGFSAECWSSTVLACHKAQKMCRLRMPAIFRQEGIAYMEQNRKLLAEAGFDGLVVRSLEEVGWQREQEEKFPKHPHFLMIFDDSLYIWNRLAEREMKRLGAERLTFPAELNRRELNELVHIQEQNTLVYISELDEQAGISETFSGGKELLVYGRLPMMVSAQCIQKTSGGCTRKRGILWLKDRTGKQLPVKNHCNFCYNTIYNASPLSLLDQEQLVKELKPAALRMQFTTETPEEVQRLLAAFAGRFIHGRPEVFPYSDYTRGHIRRGVE